MFSWTILTDTRFKEVGDNIYFRVLILVLLDDTHRLAQTKNGSGRGVLILVLLDDTHRPWRRLPLPCSENTVLILVLLDDTHRQQVKSPGSIPRIVLILVLLDDTHRRPRRCGTQPPHHHGLNPCSLGRYSPTVALTSTTASSENVLILVLLDDTHRQPEDCDEAVLNLS